MIIDVIPLNAYTDEALFDQVFEAKGSSCIMDIPACLGSYMGVYERSVLSKIDIPVIYTKEESIFFEIEWTQRYIVTFQANIEIFKDERPLSLHVQR